MKVYLVMDLNNTFQHELIEVWRTQESAQKRADELSKQDPDSDWIVDEEVVNG